MASTTILDEVFVSKTPSANSARYPYYCDEVSLYLQDGTDAGITLNNFILSGDTASFDVTFSYDKLLNYFMDIRIVNAICTALDKSIEEITDEDLQTITSLSLSSVGNYDLSVDLTGLEHLSNLQTLVLNDCKIDDITPIGTLTNLTHLELVNNEIEDFSPLENLTSLTYLKIRGNISSDYSAAAEYYNSLTEKDFSLNNQNDVVFNVQNYSNQHNIGNVRIICSDTVPDKIHIVIEKYSADGTLLLKSKRENVSLTSNAPLLYLSSDFNCQDGSYIVISAYERRKFTKLISKCTVKPVTFDFTAFN